MEQLISGPEAARRLGLSRQRLFQLCKDGRIKGARKIGRQWVIPEGAKIEGPPPRPSRTIEIPPAKGSGKAASAVYTFDPVGDVPGATASEKYRVVDGDTSTVVGYFRTLAAAKKIETGPWGHIQVGTIEIPGAKGTKKPARRAQKP